MNYPFADSPVEVTAAGNKSQSEDEGISYGARWIAPRFEIWREGYKTEKESGPAEMMGAARAADFAAACIRFFEPREDKAYFNPHTMTYRGCQLFDNEADARKNFG